MFFAGFFESMVDNIYEVKFPASFGLVLGNESHGVSKDVSSTLDYSISIPKYNNRKIDSLNVAISSAIVISEANRQLKLF